MIYDNRGFSFIEIVVVFSIITILAVIAVPYFFGQTTMAKRIVCNTNCMQLERLYETYLLLENKDHSKTAFANFKLNYDEDICPDNSINIRYIDDKVECSLHPKEANSESDGGNNETAPFL